MFDVNWETRSHADIHAQLQGRGAGFTDAGGAWNSLATRLRDVAGLVERATSGIAATRTGPAAQAAGTAVGPMGPWADEVRGFSDAVGSASHEQNRALTATRGVVGPPVARPPVTLQTWEGVGALAALDVDSAEHASLDAERRARAAMGRYQEFSSLRASGLPQFSSPGQNAPQIQLVTGGGAAAPVGGVSGGSETGTTAGPPGGGGAAGGSVASGGGPVAGGASGAGGGVAAGGAATGGGGGAAAGGAGGGAATGTAGPGVVPGAATGGGATGGAATGGAATGGAATGGAAAGGAVTGGSATGGAATGGATPGGGAIGGATGGAVAGVPAGGAVAAGGSAGAGRPLTTGPGAGSTPGSTTAIGAASSPARPGLGGLAGAAESPTFGPTGTGAASSSATRLPVENTRLGGAPVLEPALGPRSATTNTGVPFAPIGGVGGAPPGDQRLPRASYLVEDDPDALAGELPRVAPPVIGE